MNWEKIYFLKPSDFKYPDKMDEEFLIKLDKFYFAVKKYSMEIHNIPNIKLIITSSYRTHQENIQAGGVANSAHTEVPCKAVDVWLSGNVVNSIKYDILLRCAIQIGFKRIGIYKEKLLIHLDESDNLPSPRIWQS